MFYLKFRGSGIRKGTKNLPLYVSTEGVSTDRLDQRMSFPTEEAAVEYAKNMPRNHPLELGSQEVEAVEE